MSYLVLARKSRPQSFAEVVGQRAVVKTLKNSIVRGRIAHAILFSGVRGVGKTTLARIMAKAINCQASLANRPCNDCPSCLNINSGQTLDLVEIDGASNRGIQEIRELRENIKFMPAHSAHKVIIIDEVHMLTTEAFNALLKTLEEPPAHVYFMFATTEIHKIPVTILSRCQQYELKKISASELTAHFSKLAEMEGVSIEPAALALIVREAAGSVRDGLSLLDQMFSYGDETLSLSDVTEVLGLVDRDLIMALTGSLLAGKRKEVFSCLDTVFSHGVNTRRFVEDLLDNFRNLLFCSIRGCEVLVDVGEEEYARLQSLALEYAPETIHLKLTLLMEVFEALHHAANPRLVLEIALLKIIEAKNVTPLSSLLGQLATLSPQLAELDQLRLQAVKTEPACLPKKAVTKESIPPAKQQKQKKGSIKKNGERARSGPALSKEPPPLEQQEDDSSLLGGAETAIETEKKSLDPDSFQKSWPDFLEFLEKDTIWLASVMSSAKKYELNCSDGQLVLDLSFSDWEDAALLDRQENFQRFTTLLFDFFREKITIQLHRPQRTEETDGNSPRARRNKLMRDPLVKMAEDVFRGKVSAVRLSTLQNSGKTK